MAIAALIAFVVVYVIISVAYGTWLEKGFRTRRVVTRLSPEQLRDIFISRVARAGWSVVDDDNPIVAQSGLMAGRRQQIALSVARQGDWNVAVISVPRFWRKRGTPYKAHTLRLRMNSFLSAVTEADGAAQISG